MQTVVRCVDGIRGRAVDSGEPYTRTMTADGISTASVGSQSFSGGVPHLEGLQENFICLSYPASSNNCFVIFRNPAGTPERGNEYVNINQSQRYEFSIVE